ncbi:hypothetical protein [Paenibacillus sp. 1-18]|uniref:hypothetical protein n=1 Tax=Paenibacillus sp. 1-18 TaxID=1333846 RepID=UPI00046F6A31|nr:hypothetical protein [Paenibacillus sp. 1-18]
MTTIKINHEKEAQQISNSIFIYDKTTTNSFIKAAGMEYQEYPCVAVQGVTDNPQFIEDIHVWYEDRKGNIHDAFEYPFGNIENDPYTYNHFRYTFDEYDKVANEITIDIRFVGGEKFSFVKKLSDYTFFNKQLQRMFYKVDSESSKQPEQIEQENEEGERIAFRWDNGVTISVQIKEHDCLNNAISGALKKLDEVGVTTGKSLGYVDWINGK